MRSERRSGSHSLSSPRRSCRRSCFPVSARAGPLPPIIGQRLAHELDTQRRPAPALRSGNLQHGQRDSFWRFLAGYGHTKAGTAEAVIGAALLLGLALTWLPSICLWAFIGAQV